MNFHTLDPELVATQTQKYDKNVVTLEKGLPPNNVLPLLKVRVEAMIDQVNVT